MAREQIRKITLEHDKFLSHALRAIAGYLYVGWICIQGHYGCLEKMDQTKTWESFHRRIDRMPHEEVEYHDSHNVEKNLDFNYNCSPGESWGCGILPRVTMSQEKAESCKRQAASHKQQASSKVGSKAFGGKRVRQIVARHYVTKTQGASDKRQAPSSKHQAASHELLAL
jgi:hypothetical protein